MSAQGDLNKDRKEAPRSVTIGPIRPIGPMKSDEKLIPAHGGYRKLKSYQNATIVYDFTFDFCEAFIVDRRLKEQMVHAARSGRQNIAEGCQASGTSKKTEIKLIGVARASLEELLIDYEDFLRQHHIVQWGKDSPEVKEARALATRENRSYMTYRSYMSDRGRAANAAICLIHQTNYLLDQQLRVLEEVFLKEGGFTERLYRKRSESRGL